MSEPKAEEKIISFADFKTFEDLNGGFKGYCNNFGVLDAYDDITIKECFTDSIQSLIDEGFGAADHKWGIKDEIGIVTKAHEDEIGLFVEVAYHPDTDSQKIRQKVNNRLVNNKKVSMSIGYRTLEKEYVVGEEAVPFLINPPQQVLTYLKEKQPIVRILKKCLVFEPSVVSMGANRNSAVTEGKSAPILTKEEIQIERKKLLNTGDALSQKIQILNLKLRLNSA